MFTDIQKALGDICQYGSCKTDLNTQHSSRQTQFQHINLAEMYSLRGGKGFLDNEIHMACIRKIMNNFGSQQSLLLKSASKIQRHAEHAVQARQMLNGNKE